MRLKNLAFGLKLIRENRSRDYWWFSKRGAIVNNDAVFAAFSENEMLIESIEVSKDYICAIL